MQNFITLYRRMTSNAGNKSIFYEIFQEFLKKVVGMPGDYFREGIRDQMFFSLSSTCNCPSSLVSDRMPCFLLGLPVLRVRAFEEIW